VSSLSQLIIFQKLLGWEINIREGSHDVDGKLACSMGIVSKSSKVDLGVDQEGLGMVPQLRIREFFFL
jgi:hypothetical protein